MSDTKVLTILLTRGPYVSEAADMALKTALKARRMGYEVNLFLYLDGTWNSHITGEKDYSNPGEWLRSVVKRGINVTACERCYGARDLNEDNTVEGVRIAGSYSFMEMLKNSDKVLTFGG
jgi:tRNA 2-thiouridine synthesizing protein D